MRVPVFSIHSFLSNRYHFVRLPGASSTASPVISGVPQGTVLGPLLFLMIDIGVLNAKVVSFADDTQLYSNVSGYFCLFSRI